MPTTFVFLAPKVLIPIPRRLPMLLRVLCGFLASLALLASDALLAQSPPKPPQLVGAGGAGNLVHDFTGLPLTADGWTDFEGLLTSDGYADARLVFVSSTIGDDSVATTYGVDIVNFDEYGMFQPSAPVQPFKTLKAAYAQIRPGHPDVLLLKRGDEWQEGFGVGGAGRVKSGRTKTERHIIASYGVGDRPRLFAGIIDADNASFTIIAGLHSYENDWRTASRGMQIDGPSDHQLFEDMRFDAKHRDIIQGGSVDTAPVSNIAIRRCFYSHYRAGGTASDGFLYVSRVDGMLFEENVFYEPWSEPYPDESRHGRHLYLSSSTEESGEIGLTNLILRGNIFYRGERESGDFRAGGTIHNNLFLQNDLVTVGGRGGSRNKVLSASLTNNVFMQGTPNTGQMNRLDLINLEGAEISRNVWTDPRYGTKDVNVIGIRTSTEIKIFKDVEISNNVIHGFRANGQKSRAIDLSSDFLDISDVVIQQNHWQFVTGSAEIVRHRDWVGSGGDRFVGFTYYGNKYFTTQSEGIFSPGDTYVGWLDESRELESEFGPIEYPDADRTVDSYMESHGLNGGAEEFMRMAIKQSRHDWNPIFSAPAINSYIRAGFGLESPTSSAEN